MHRIVPVLASVFGLSVALAHDVPIPDSTCAFSPLEVRFPALGRAGTAAAPGVGDVMRIKYTAPRQSAQFDATGVPPRALSGLGTSASLAAPLVFDTLLFGSGNDGIADIPLDLTVDGTTATVSVRLTTGLASAGGVVVEGAPMSASGTFTLVGAGVVNGLGAPFDGAVAVFTLTCAATPKPDLDQFPIVETKGLGGRITTRRLRLYAQLDLGTLTPALSGVPVLLRASADGTPVATVDLPGGLVARGSRTFIATSGDGKQKVVLHLRRRRPTLRYALSVRVDETLPALPAGRPVVTLTSQLGALVSRGSKPFRGAH